MKKFLTLLSQFTLILNPATGFLMVVAFCTGYWYLTPLGFIVVYLTMTFYEWGNRNEGNYVIEELLDIIQGKLGLSKKDLTERLEEFDVIKNEKIDLISLNHLFDYLGKDYNVESIRKELESNKIECII